MRVGSGIADITPEIGIPLSGFAIRRNRPSVAVDDPLYLKAIALEDGADLYLLLSYDLIGLESDLHASLDQVLWRELGNRYRSDHVVITTTHTHSGPPTVAIAGEDRVPESYREYLAQATARAIRQAIGKLDEGALYHAQADIRGLTYNRRFDLRGQKGGDREAATGGREFVDSSLDLFVFRNHEGGSLASFVSFACHGVTMMTQHISADFPGELTRRLSLALGAPCLFLPGAMGDVNPTVVSQDHMAMLAFVDELAGQLEDIVERLEEATPGPLSAREAVATLPYAAFPPRQAVLESIEKNRRIASGDLESPELQPLVDDYGGWKYPEDLDTEQNVRHWGAVFTEVHSRTLAAIDDPGKFPPPPFRIVAWELGPFMMVFLSGEILTSVGRHIREMLPHHRVQVISLLAPVVGYICDRDDYQLGGYEPLSAPAWYRRPGPFAESTESIILKELTSLLASL